MRVHIAILTTPTGSFAKDVQGKSLQDLERILREYIKLSFMKLTTGNQYNKGDTLIFVMPEFLIKGEEGVFLTNQDKKLLLGVYKKISHDYSDLLIIANVTSHTSKLKHDSEGEMYGHKPKIHKVNAVYAFLAGDDIFKHYKTHLGEADIPENEKQGFEVERTKYLDKKSKSEFAPGILQINGLTIGIDICLDYAKSNLKNLVLNHYHQEKFLPDKLGVDFHIVLSSSLDNALWKGLDTENPVGLVGKSHCFFVQADGNGQKAIREKRSGIWMIDQDNKTVSKMNNLEKSEFSDYELSVYRIELSPQANLLNTEIPNNLTHKI